VKTRWAVTAKPKHGLRHSAGGRRVRPVLWVAGASAAVAAALAVWIGLAAQSNPIALAGLTFAHAPEMPVASTTLPAPTQWPLPTDIRLPWLPVPSDVFDPMPAPEPQPPAAPRGPAPNVIPPNAPVPTNAGPLPTPTAPQPTPPPADYCDPRVDLCVH
jgi:hypothetical protein